MSQLNESLDPTTSATYRASLRAAAASILDRDPEVGEAALSELRTLCQDLMRALTAEEHAVGAGGFILGEGRRDHDVGLGSIYRFGIGDVPDASIGDPVVLRIRCLEVDGVITAVTAGSLDIRLSSDVGAHVPAGATLILEAPWLVRKLRRRIVESFELGLLTPQLFNLRNALRTLAIGTIDVGSEATPPAFENARRPLNEEQERAVSIALRSPVSVIASPGGTGKTLTLGALVEACYGANLRVLVTAPSNAAVDVATSQICERLSQEPGFASGDVLRIGCGVGSALRAQHGPNVVLDEVAQRLRPQLHSQGVRLRARTERLARDVTRARREANQLPSARVDALARELARARAELREHAWEVRDYTRRLTSGARVVASTLATVFLDRYINGFDVVIIDEASMAHLPAVFVAAGLASRHVVLSGDPYQLGVPVKSRATSRQWLAEDVFTRLGVLKAIGDEKSLPYLTQLVEQRRSAPGICELLAKVWYGPTLRTSRDVIQRERDRHNVIFQGSSLCYIDTAPLSPYARHPWGKTVENVRHAELILDLLEYLDSGGELPRDGAQGTEALILSHYRGQVARIKRTIGSRYDGRGVDARTVHRSQGGEATTCIFDLTLSRGVDLGANSLVSATEPTDEGSRLLAVACSRARSRLVIVGDMQWLRQSVTRESKLHKVYSYLVEHGYEIPLREVRRRKAA